MLGNFLWWLYCATHVPSNGAYFPPEHLGLLSLIVCTFTVSTDDDEAMRSEVSWRSRRPHYLSGRGGQLRAAGPTGPAVLARDLLSTRVLSLWSTPGDMVTA